MQRHFAWAGGLVLGFGLFLTGRPALAVITRLTPLKEVLGAEQLIFVARVASMDPKRPSAVFEMAEPLKGKPPFTRIPVNMTGDAEGQKQKHSAQMFKRLANDLPVVFFTSRRGNRYTAFAYSNGTWFQLIGTVDEGDQVRWAFTHCEPYLRRTFKGSTSELMQVVRDGLAGKKPPPDPDPKEPPGLGPEVEPKKGARRTGGPIFAVIPTFVIMGPLALLATLFPAIFGGLALFMKRWLVFLSVACLNSTLFTVYLWWKGAGNLLPLWLAMTAITAVGALWSAWRFRAAQNRGIDYGNPGRGERTCLAIASLVGLAIVLWAGAVVESRDWWSTSWLPQVTGWSAEGLLQTPWMEFLAFWFGIWAGALYLVYQRMVPKASAPHLPTELVALWAMVFAGVGLGGLAAGSQRTAAGTFESTSSRSGERLAQPQGVVWTFDVGSGSVISSPLVAEDRVYIATIQGAGFSSYGVLYCLNRETGQVVWKFDNDGEMLQGYSTPCLAGGRLYFGEGLHENRGCRFYCLRADTGQKLWQFETSSHTESSPCVADGKVYFGAGDDGVDCLDAGSGTKIWQYQRDLHVDADPMVVNGRLYCGSGVSKTFKKTQIFCLDATTGQPLWAEDTDLPVWGSPVLFASQAFFGLGTGRLGQKSDNPAGALLCVDAENGRRLWRLDVPAGVLTKVEVDAFNVYIGCQDGFAYCVDRRDGRQRWKQALGSPASASPVVARCTCCDATTTVLFIGQAGRIACLGPADGKIHWSFDLAGDSGWQPEMFSSPAVIVRTTEDGERRRYFFGAGLVNPISGQIGRVYCLEDRFGAH
jgi:outer membrane protein assembly factor BamB